MYIPTHFAEQSQAQLKDVIRSQPFATLIASTSDGLTAEHLPLLLDTRGAHGVLQGHVARVNPVWQKLADGAEVLAVFHGPHHYISPNWYPSKREHGKAVPTWNYVVVHARGTISWMRDRSWLRAFIERLVDTHEHARPHPWRLDDAPPEYIERTLEAIVGFEIRIAALSGKWKLNQNRSAGDRAGVIEGLDAEGTRRASEVAELMRSNQT